MSENKTNPIVLVTVIGIFALLFALVVIIGLYSIGVFGSKEKTAKTPPRDLTANQSVERTELEDQGVTPQKPSAPVDTARLVMTYKPGVEYRTQVSVTVSTKGSHKDWGVVASSNSHFIAELEFIRKIESNNGNKLVVLQEFTKAVTLEAFTQIDGISLELGSTGQGLLEVGGILSGMPPGWSKIGVDQINDILASSDIKKNLGRITRDNNANLFVNVDSLNGKKARITLENGIGVTRIEAVDCTLTGDEQAVIADSSLASDIFIMPNVECKPGDTWQVRGEDFLPIIDPSMKASLTGTVTARRGENSGTKDRPVANIILDRGVFNFADRDSKQDVVASWAPKGNMEYDFVDNIVTSGVLSGDLSIKSRSVDHILFEMEITEKPVYEVRYFCEILK